MHVINETLRVTPLSDTLVRIEVKGPIGFEDNSTFHVVSRSFSMPDSRSEEHGNETRVLTETYHVSVPKNACTLEGVEIRSANSDQRVTLAESSLTHTPLPSPGKMPFAWVMADTPRVVPPAWGATPAPPEAADDIHSGWSIENDAPDVYVFIPGEHGYERLREEFLKLTGPTPLPPLYAFGLIYSRFFPYSQGDVLDRIDEFRRRSIPLDMFVVDTDWRIGASHGYAVNEELFPDMPGLLKAAHDRKVRVMFNDHPEPVDKNGLSPKEFRYRQESLHGLFSMGLDAWWYDRNWHIGLNPPQPGMRHDLWGMRLYRDLTQQYFPGRRPFVLSNTICVTDGKREEIFAPAEHRFPVWWTGDTGTDWHRLALAIGSAVDLGVTACLPYVSEDLPGFYGQPSAELFVRYLQFGSLSPIMRLHGAPQATRYPWVYGEETESIVAAYIRLRYRLLPTIYAAAHTASRTGQPVLRRCDLYWPEIEEASQGAQYLLGDDLLVAPITTPTEWDLQALPEGTLLSEEGKPGLTATYFDNGKLLGSPMACITAPESMFAEDALSAGPPPYRGAYAVRWTGSLCPVEDPGQYTFLIKACGQVKLYLNGALQEPRTEAKGKESLHAIDVDFSAGQPVAIGLELRFGRFAPARCRLSLVKNRAVKEAAKQEVWIPPGRWVDLWTGDCIVGPIRHIVESSLRSMPLFVREGGLVLTTPVAPHTEAVQWNDIVVNAFVPQHDSEVTRYLYQDDTISNGYKDGQFNRTALTFCRKGDRITLTIRQAECNVPELKSSRRWTLRLHTQEGQSVDELRVDDERAPETQARILERDESNRAMPFAEAEAAAPSGPVVEVSLPDRDGTVFACRAIT